MDKIRILLVEDDEADARLLQRSFSKVRSFDTEIIHSPRLTAACEKLANEDFDLVLLDLSLPDGDGMEVIERIKATKAHTPIVVLTGLRDEDAALAALKRGAHEYLIKGEISASFLPKVIRYAIESARHRIELETEVKNRTEDLRIAHERALRSERLATVGQMVTGLAHESRNSLQRIQSSINKLCRRSDGREDLLAISSDLESAVDDLRNLYDTVREYAAPLNLSRNNVDLVDLFKDTIKKVETALGEDNAVTVKIESESHCSLLHADTGALQQVYRNIIENAIQACAPKKVELHFRCTDVKQEEGDFLCISIRDRGPGLTAEQQERLFEPFYTTKNKGTGLGLAISKRLIEAHGGSISVTIDTPESGAIGLEIVILLPTYGDNRIEGGSGCDCDSENTLKTEREIKRELGRK